MKKLNLILVLVILILQGCTLAKITGSGPVPVYMNIGHKKVEKVVHVETKKFRAFDYTGSFDVSEALKKKYDKEYADGNTELFDAITNVHVHVKRTFKGWLVNLITLGIANARTIRVEADIVWYKDE